MTGIFGAGFGLPILSKEAVFEIMKNLISIERIIAACERPAREGMNEIKLIEEALFLALPNDLLMRKLTQRPEG